MATRSSLRVVLIFLVVFSLWKCNITFLSRDVYTYSISPGSMGMIDNGIKIKKRNVYISGGMHSVVSGMNRLTHLDSVDSHAGEDTFVTRFHMVTYYLPCLLNVEFGAGLNDYLAVGSSLNWSLGKSVVPKERLKSSMKKELIWTGAFVRLNIPAGKMNSVLRYDLIGNPLLGYDEIIMKSRLEDKETQIDTIVVDTSKAFGFRVYDVENNLSVVLNYKIKDEISAFWGMSYRKRLIAKNVMFNQRYFKNVYSFCFGINYRFGKAIILSPYVVYSFAPGKVNRETSLSAGIRTLYFK